MAHVHAKKMRWPKEVLSFEVVNTLEGAAEALGSGRADYFMWEKFTTQPLVDRAVFRRIGVCPTPWPCFVIAATVDFSLEYPGVLADLLETINTYTREFKSIPSIDRTLANQYGLQLEGVREWLSITRWSQDQIGVKDIDNVINTLSELNLLSKPLSPEFLLWKR